MGDAAGVPVVEYGSLTCPHCAVFSREVLPATEEGLHRHRQGALHLPRILAQHARRRGLRAGPLLGDDKAFAAIELLFSQQDKWAFVDKPLEPLIAAMRPTGLTHDQATACLKDQTNADAIAAVGKRASDEINMNGTPTFVIDGKVYGGELDPRPVEGDPRPAGQEVASRASPGEKPPPGQRAHGGADERRERIPGGDEERRIVGTMRGVEQRRDAGRGRAGERASPCRDASARRPAARRSAPRASAPPCSGIIRHADHRIVADEAGEPLVRRDDHEFDDDARREQNERRQQPQRQRPRLRVGTSETQRSKQRRQGERKSVDELEIEAHRPGGLGDVRPRPDQERRRSPGSRQTRPPAPPRTAGRAGWAREPDRRPAPR